MVSSCVPASPFESGGAEVRAEDIARFLEEEPRALGVAEMMNFAAVAAGDDEALAKVEVAERMGRHVDGHAPGLTGEALNAYLAAGVRSDHECTTYREALEKRRLGMWIMIREGSAARNLESLLPLVLERAPQTPCCARTTGSPTTSSGRATSETWCGGRWPWDATPPTPC
jgi:adenine deaminase